MEDCEKLEEVYTYDNDIGKCRKIKWRGCETYNKFDDYGTCVLACSDITNVSNELDDYEISDGSHMEEAGNNNGTSAGPLDEYAGNESPATAESEEDEVESREENTNDETNGSGTPEEGDDNEAASD